MSVEVISTLCVGAALLGSFVAWERFTKFPMIPGYMFAEKVST